MPQQHMQPQDAVMLIPSLEPDNRLPAYVRQLLAKGFCHIVIVDDGSAASYQPIFSELDAMEGVCVTHHEVNRGKGCALKTGYRYIAEHFPDASSVITADADGQHTVADCWKLAQALAQGEHALYLGSRNFNLPNIPPKSRFGNKTTSAVFRLLYGVYLPDTQTGLRAFSMSDLPFMLEVKGDRFEYEMQVLIACARAHLPILPIEIETVYENENAGTHFHPLRDSYRIYKVILGSFIKFMAASLTSFLIDQGVFALMHYVVLARVNWYTEAIQAVSTIVARLISAPCNFLMNRSFVFKFKENTRATALKYAALCVVIMALSSLGVTLFSKLGMPEELDNLSKLIIDTLLYFLSYRVQNRWIFTKQTDTAKEAQG